jgi:SAM-dependent methyltransferase
MIGGRVIKLDIGCGPNKKSGYIGVDKNNYPGVDHIIDFMNGLPFSDNSVDEIRAYDFIEHVSDKSFTLREFWRVCKEGAIVDIQVPDASVGQGAFRDPTHLSFWVPQSFLPMYMDSGPYHPGGYCYKVDKLHVTKLYDEVRWIKVQLIVSGKSDD